LATYTRGNNPWANNQSGGTEIDADALNNFENGIAGMYEIVNAKGDLIVATAADTLGRLAVGANNYALVADSSQTVGAKWVDLGTLVVPLSIFTAKGDLLVATGSGAVDNLAVGTNGQVPVADSTAGTGIRWDNVAAPSSFTSYTPAWTSSGTAPSLGNGTAAGAYITIGTLIAGYLQITIGSTSTNGTGTYNFSLPVSASVTTSRFPLGVGMIRDSGTAQWSCIAAPGSGTTVELYVANGTANHPVTSNTVPMTPATGDTYQVLFVYRSA